MIKCIIFDLGGVVVDFYNETDYYPYLARISGIPLADVKRIVEFDIRVDIEKGNKSEEYFNKAIARQLSIKESTVMWYASYKKKAKIFRGTANIVKKLHKNYELAFLSNIDRSRYEYTAEKIIKPYLPYFSHRFVSYEIGYRKPSKQIYQYALRKMGAKANETLFIDNQIENVVGARKLGIRAIWFKSPKDLERRLKKLRIRF